MFFHSLLGVIQSLHEKKQNMMSWNVERFFGGMGCICVEYSKLHIYECKNCNTLMFINLMCMLR